MNRKSIVYGLFLIAIGFGWGFLSHRNHVFPYSTFVDIVRPLLVKPKPVYDSWPQKVKEVTTHEDHKAMVYISDKKDVPLVLDLHPWDGHFRQYVHASVNEVIGADWHYCHPDFGGQNWLPDTMLSANVLVDLDRSIDYMLKNIKGDPKIAVIGVSGGGLASLTYQIKSSHSISACIAWSPLTRLDHFYEQSKIQNYPFAEHMHISTGIEEKDQLFIELKKRSPYELLKFNHQLCPTIIYSGVLDEIIPLSQVTDFFNHYVTINQGHKKIDKEVERSLVMHLPLKNNLSDTDKLFHVEKYANLELRVHAGGHDRIGEKLIEDLKGLLEIE